jgi:hypothetical protein
MAHFSITTQIWQYLGKVKNPRELSRISSLGLKLKEISAQNVTHGVNKSSKNIDSGALYSNALS